MDELPRIGCEIGENKPSIFELVLSDHIEFVDPKDFGIEAESINPADYFVTSGDAAEKARVLEEDYWKLAGKLRRQIYQKIIRELGVSYKEALYHYNNSDKPKDGLYGYMNAIWRNAGKARKLHNLLDEARGEDCFLETEWDEDHRLRCIPKNPRGPRE